MPARWRSSAGPSCSANRKSLAASSGYFRPVLILRCFEGEPGGLAGNAGIVALRRRRSPATSRVTPGPLSFWAALWRTSRGQRKEAPELTTPIARSGRFWAVLPSFLPFSPRPKSPDLSPVSLKALAVTCISRTGLAGLEPTTYGLGNRRSIRLSYSPRARQAGARAVLRIERRLSAGASRPAGQAHPALRGQGPGARQGQVLA